MKEKFIQRVDVLGIEGRSSSNTARSGFGKLGMSILSGLPILSIFAELALAFSLLSFLSFSLCGL